MNSLMKPVKGGSASISVKPSSGGKRHSRRHSSRKSHSSSRRRHHGGSNALKNLFTGGEAAPADLNIFKGTGAGTPSSFGGKRRSRKHSGRKHGRSHRRKMRGGECSSCPSSAGGEGMKNPLTM